MDYKEPSAAPPPYSEHPAELTSAFSALDLEKTSIRPSTSQCLVHLKLLEAFSRLREEIGTQNGLYGISDSLVQTCLTELPKAELSAKLREKRWATYVTNACMRFQVWWERCIVPGGKMLRQKDMTTVNFANITKSKAPLEFTQDNLPPLGVCPGIFP